VLLERAWIHLVDGGRRAAIVRRVTRTLKALRAASAPLRPRERGFGLDRTSGAPVPARLPTAAAVGLDDVRRRRYCRIIFAGCDTQPPSHRPMWSTVESLVAGHDSLPSRLPSLVVCSCDVTSAKPTDPIGLRVGPRPCAKSDRLSLVEIITPSGRHACPVSMHGTAPSAPALPHARVASTLEMGRRIMAERRRPRTRRGRRYQARTRATNAAASIDAADAALRAFVRALARQAARDCFEDELKRRSEPIQ
jgi:hypothetical protein